MQNKLNNKKYNQTGPFRLVKIISLLALFLVPVSNNLFAQSDSLSTFLKVKLKDRSDFIGEQIRNTKDSLVLRDEDGRIIALNRKDIRYSYKVQPGTLRNGKYRPHLFNYDKGFVAPTAFGPKKGEVYFENYMLVWNELNVGINDYISVRLGFDTWGMAMRLSDDDYYSDYYEPVVLVAPKISFPLIQNKWHFAITPAILNIPDDDGFLDYGFLFLTNTFGNKNNNFTIGLGGQIFGTYEDLLENTYLTFSAQLRLGAKVALTTENWIIMTRYEGVIDDTYMLNNVGIKILGNHLNWSISVARSLDSFINSIPILGVALPISRGGAWKS